MERQFLVANVAAECLAISQQRDPSVLTSKNLQWNDFESWRDELSNTYFIRLFAEFEGRLRAIWPTLRGKEQHYAARKPSPKRRT